MKTRIILNPGAGSAGSVDDFTRTVHGILPEAEIAVALSHDHLTRLAREALDAGCETVLAAGGDGTLNGVLHGLAAAFSPDETASPRVRLGVLPLGTGNDFARSAGVPADLEHALAVAREGQTRRVDVVRVSAASCVRHMINVSSGGFGTKVSKSASEGAKDLWGRLGYAASFVGALPERDEHTAVITLDDDRETLSLAVHGIIVANARYVAGGVPIAPTAQLDDGLADLVILPVASLPEIALLTPLTLLGRHLESDGVVFRRARRIVIRSEPPMRFNADGELLPAEPITFQVLPRVIDFIVGPGTVIA